MRRTGTPVQGKTYQLKLEQFENTVVNATVLSYTRSGGELLLRLSVGSDVTPVLSMRTCQARLGNTSPACACPPIAFTRCGMNPPAPWYGVVVVGRRKPDLLFP
jgi:hypothetical protein